MKTKQTADGQSVEALFTAIEDLKVHYDSH